MRKPLNLVVFLIAASALDALLTDYGIRGGSIGEANPLMGKLYAYSPALFLILKLTLPFTLLPLLAKPRISKSIHRMLGAACFVYLFVLFLHGVWLLQLLVPI